MSRWFILRTSGGHTLGLAASLRGAGHAVWTPGRTLRRYVRAKTPTGTRLIESEVAILPTFVFAREPELVAIAAETAREQSPHVAFSIFRIDGRVPLIGDREIQGLRNEEAERAAEIAALRVAESHEEAERIRIAMIKSEAARRRAERQLERGRRSALRAGRAPFAPGADVQVIEMPALVGVRGVFERVDGPYAHVRFGAHSWKVEDWRVLPAPLNDNSALRGAAA